MKIQNDNPAAAATDTVEALRASVEPLLKDPASWLVRDIINKLGEHWSRLGFNAGPYAPTKVVATDSWAADLSGLQAAAFNGGHFAEFVAVGADDFSFNVRLTGNVIVSSQIRLLGDDGKIVATTLITKANVDFVAHVEAHDGDGDQENVIQHIWNAACWAEDEDGRQNPVLMETATPLLASPENSAMAA
jgi:hypothetical protein